MNKFKKLKKALALVLVFCMVMGSIPATAFASTEKEPIDAAIIFSDLHTDKNDYKDATIKGVFNALKATNLPFSSITSGGDAFSVNKDSDSSPNGKYDGSISKITESIQSVMGKTIPISYLWSDHDRYAKYSDGTSLSKESGFTYGAGKDGVLGTTDDGNYYIYSLSMADLSSWDRYNAGFFSATEISKHIEVFKEDAAKLIKSKPLLIVGHQPLFDDRGDNGYAYQWATAINEVAANMDVVYFHGHNHNYDAESNYYYEKGTTMSIPTTKVLSGSGYSTDLESKNVKINFTHINAGYLSPATGNESNTRKGTALAVTIYDDSINYATYNSNGKYTGKFAKDITVERDYVLTEEPETPVVPDTPEEPSTTVETPVEFDGITATVSGAYDVSASAVSTEDAALIAEKGYEDYKVININATLPENGKATIKFPIPEAWEGKEERIVGISSEGEDGLVEKEGTVTDGFFTFEVEHFSAKGIAVLAEESEEMEQNDYPTYPNPGSVELEKTAEPLDQNTGLTRVNLSASGLPVNKGVDVIVMLDTSSSMDRCVNKKSNGEICNEYTGIYSSKGDDCNCTTPTTRVDELKTALKELENTLKTSPNANDIKIAVADFNGMYNSGATNYGCEKQSRDETQDTGGMISGGRAKVFTGTKSLNKDAFVSANQLNVDNFGFNDGTDCVFSGTNYDYAFDAIYQLGYAIKQENKKNNKENRELFVLFMSDGAPNQFNYYRTTGGNNGSTDWNYWLTGTVESNGGFPAIVKCQNHTYYYDETNHNQHRMANAIKGNTDTLYDVIRKTNNDSLKDALITPSQGDKYYNKANMYKLNGLGATMYSIAFYVSNDGPIEESSAKFALQQIGTSLDHYVDATNGTALSKAFHNIATEIAYAATNAVFTDIMGDDFKLQLATKVTSNANDATNHKETVDTSITVSSENVYVPSQVGTTVLGHDVTASDVGKPYGDPTVLETVTFNEDGTIATSNKLTDSNILKNGIICAKTFVYNTTNATKEVTLADNSVISLGPDEFYWTIGTINQKRYTLSYVVYLKGSMEGTREAGSYATNDLAKLTYDNWLGNRVSQTVPSPVVAWGKAQVSYAFYLVNDQGQPLYADGMVAPNFGKAYKVTNPVVYGAINLNASEDVISALGNEVLPKEYELYDNDASYEVKPLSGDGKDSGWTITASDGKKLTDTTSTTYVTGYAGSNDYTNEMEMHNQTYAYTDTTVYFAVKWSIQALPDTVVIDYGLPVDINVLKNDMFGDYGKLAGVGPVASANLDAYDQSMNTNFGNIYANKDNNKPVYGIASVNGDKVRYTPDNMEMNNYDKFAYAVEYTGSVNRRYYYDTVTVIPATTIYYEDSFVEYENLVWQQKENGQPWEGCWAVDADANGSIWKVEGTTVSGAVQQEDRPGKYSLTDANNIYGYDEVNKNMATYSMGSARKATVNYDNAAQASFKFWGTGFDVISMTDNTTGVILVDVYSVNSDGSVGTDAVKSFTVDTYYGYTREYHKITYKYENNEWVILSDEKVDVTGTSGERPKNPKENETYTVYTTKWIAAPNNPDTLYQVPVMEVENLAYGHYQAVIKAVYEPAFDHVVDENQSYDFYLDAIRIYDPANDGTTNTKDKTIEDAYKADNEGWPSYIELRNKLLNSGSLGNSTTSTVVEGLVFIDCNAQVGNQQITDYENYGPNNEVYLAPGQRVAFMLDTPENISRVHIGIKNADGRPSTYTITNIAKANSADGKVDKGDYYNPKTYTLNTTTDMYYDLTEWKNDIIVISNTGNNSEATGGSNTAGIISLTNIKSTYKENPNTTVTTSDGKADANETSIYMTPEAATLTLKRLNTSNAELLSLSTDKSSYVVKDTVKATVKTNDDAEYVTVNGEKITSFKESGSERIWTYTEKAVNTGNKAIEAVAYNCFDEASEEVCKNVTVKKFAPKTFKLALSKTKVVVKDSVKATVTTSSDVSYVKVNGTKVNKCTTNNSKKTKTWTVNVKASKEGKMTVKAVAFNKNNSESSAVSKNVTVNKFAPKAFKVTSSKSTVKKGAKYTVTVSTSADVSYITINGKKITKFTSNKNKTVRTFKVTYTAKTVGKNTVKVIAYNKNGAVSKAKTRTVTVKKK